MARQTGLFKIVGTLGDINFYITKGVGYARKAGGGFNGEAIKTKPSMQRVRENASEFGHCSRVKKQFRLALLPFLNGYKDSKLHARMMTLFTSIKSLDSVSLRGERRVNLGLQTAKGKRLLTHFAFTPYHGMLDGLQQHTAFDWSTQTLSVTNFSPKLYKAPKAATHVGISLGVLDFDFERLNSGLEVSATKFLEIGAEGTSFELTPSAVIVPEHTGLVVLGLRFYEVIEDEVYAVGRMIGVGIVET